MYFDCETCISGFCWNCTNDGIEFSEALRYGVLTLCFTSLCVLVILWVLVLHYRHNKIFKAASPGLLNIVLAGITIMHGEVIVSCFPPSEVTCMVTPWFRHVGFALTFGAILLKTWRVSIILKVIKPREFKISNNHLYRKVALICMAFIAYLVVWTSVQPVLYHVFHYNYKDVYFMCRVTWWDLAGLFGELLLLSWGWYVVVNTTEGPNIYDDSKHTSYVVWNETLWCIVAVFFGSVIQRYPDVNLLLIGRCLRTLVTSGVILTHFFGSKLYAIMRHDRELKCVLTDIDKETRVHRLTLLINKNGNVKHIQCRPCGPLQYTEKIPEDISAAESKIKTEKTVAGYTEYEIDRLIELVATLRTERDTYWKQAEELMSMLKILDSNKWLESKLQTLSKMSIRAETQTQDCQITPFTQSQLTLDTQTGKTGNSIKDTSEHEQTDYAQKNDIISATSTSSPKSNNVDTGYGTARQSVGDEYQSGKISELGIPSDISRLIEQLRMHQLEEKNKWTEFPTCFSKQLQQHQQCNLRINCKNVSPTHRNIFQSPDLSLSDSKYASPAEDTLATLDELTASSLQSFRSVIHEDELPEELKAHPLTTVSGELNGKLYIDVDKVYGKTTTKQRKLCNGRNQDNTILSTSNSRSTGQVNYSKAKCKVLHSIDIDESINMYI
ncbi:unnamed protein product [Owenia fusiformis]|uniref:Uncharacterized protein n=1 Tax=Owenia fusiformis TaxID=6347 RepID=A0A8J1URK9_OWEFU|nr:unnamed protein product [Owenia fusiformis]